jgi:hypothetical protein
MTASKSTITARLSDNRAQNRLSSERFLIIGGTSKAATTSLFNYLERHPQISPSSAKETRFFLDEDYPLPSKLRYQKDGPDAYLTFYESSVNAPKGSWLLEASPDYLHSANAARMIGETLTNVRFVFILRHPVSRLVSWYRFGQAMNEIPTDLTFDEYVFSQSNKTGNSSRHPAFLALEQGRYSGYLAPYFQRFGHEAVYVSFYEELQSDPLNFVLSLCRWAGIDEAYFNDYSFAVSNKSVHVRRPFMHRAYGELKQACRHKVRNLPGLRRLLKRARLFVEPVYERLNVVNESESALSPVVRQFLSDYYKEEFINLKKLLSVDLPWKTSIE